MAMDETDNGRDTRGWSMRRGHAKRLKAKRGRESTRGRAAFSRSVHNGTVYTCGCCRDNTKLGWRSKFAESQALKEVDEDKYFVEDWNAGEIDSVDYSWGSWDGDAESDSDCSSLLGLSEWETDFAIASGMKISCTDVRDELAPPPILVRSLSTPCAKSELDAAVVKAEKSYIPLRVWAALSRNSKTELGNDAQRQKLGWISTKEVDEDKYFFDDVTEPCSARETNSVDYSWDARSSCSRWEAAVALAERTAKAYRRPLNQIQPVFQHLVTRPPRRKRIPKKIKNRSPPGPNATWHHSIRNFETLRNTFLQHYERQLRSALASVLGKVVFRPTPLSQLVESNFMKARGSSTSLRPVYHGTSSANYSAIFEKGLLIPGYTSGIKVANGSVYGVGIYTAPVWNPGLSRNFSDSPKLLVCGLLDNGSASIKNHGTMTVVFDSSLVAPLFEAAPIAPTVPTVFQDMPRFQGLVAYLNRRAARRRRM